MTSGAVCGPADDPERLDINCEKDAFRTPYKFLTEKDIIEHFLCHNGNTKITAYNYMKKWW